MRKLISLLLALLLLFAGSMNVTNGVLGALAGRQAAMAEDEQSGEAPVSSGGEASSVHSSGSGSTGNGGASGEQASAPNEEGGASGEPSQPSTGSTVEIISDAVDSDEGEDEDVTGTTEPGTEEPAETEEPADTEEGEPEEEADEEPDSGIPSFAVYGELDQKWLAKWKAGKKDGLKLQYTVSTSTYDPEYKVCLINAFGLKEVRDLREEETEEDLMHNIGGSGKKIRFQAKKTSWDGKYTISESVLNALADGEYQIYALYTDAEGQEKTSILGTVSLPRPEAEALEPDLDDGPDPTVEVEILLRNSGDQAVMILKAKLSGFEGMETKLQWQYQNGNGWQDVSGATGQEYRCAASDAASSCQWRMKVSATKIPKEEAPAAVDLPAPETGEGIS